MVCLNTILFVIMVCLFISWGWLFHIGLFKYNFVCYDGVFVYFMRLFVSLCFFGLIIFVCFNLQFSLSERNSILYFLKEVSVKQCYKLMYQVLFSVQRKMYISLHMHMYISLHIHIHVHMTPTSKNTSYSIWKLS